MLSASLEIGNNLLILLMALIPAIPATIAAIAAMRSTHELKPNNGSSVADKVSELHRVVVSQDRKDDESPTVTIDRTHKN